MAEVRFENVSKTFGNQDAVRDLNLQISDHEFLVLVGPSGCGKSTTLRLLAGLEQITQGEIYIGDRLVNNVAPRDRDIAMVFQSYALYPQMTVYDNMAFGLSLRKINRHEIARRVHEVAASLGITDLLTRKPGQLSGGQRQRVALGRAIVREPTVFLLDEPLSNLDAKLRVQTRAEITKLHERLGTTFIYVTHDQTEAMTMAQRMAVMNQGCLEQIGTPNEIYNKPQTKFVAEFIGSPSMNFIPGRLAQTPEGTKLDIPALNLQTLPPCRTLTLDAPREVLIGIRPEHIHDRSFKHHDADCIFVTGRVDLVELLGHEVIVHASVGNQPLIARVDPRTMAGVGFDIDLAIEKERLYFFDVKSGQAI